MLWTLKGSFEEKMEASAKAGIQSVELVGEHERGCPAAGGIVGRAISVRFDDAAAQCDGAHARHCEQGQGCQSKAGHECDAPQRDGGTPPSARSR